MDVLVAPAVQNDGEVELESLGLGLFDVDVDLAECFKDCPEWNVSFYPLCFVADSMEAYTTGTNNVASRGTIAAVVGPWRLLSACS